MERKYRIIWHKSVDSTNLWAVRHIGELDNLSVVAAEWQSAGKGQGEHVWESEAGMNLTFSIILKYGGEDLPQMPAAQQKKVNDAVTSALLEFLGKYGIEAWIKPPNDIYVGDRKICGLLIEHKVRGSLLTASIIGIGLNVNQIDFPSHLPNPVSMRILSGQEYDLHTLLTILTDGIQTGLQLSLSF